MPELIGQVQHLVLAGFDLAGIHRYGSSRVHKNYSRGGMRFARKLRILLVHRPPRKLGTQWLRK